MIHRENLFLMSYMERGHHCIIYFFFNLCFFVRYSGATIHFVNEHYDRGHILAQRVVPVLSNDTPEGLAARVLEEVIRFIIFIPKWTTIGWALFVHRSLIVGDSQQYTIYTWYNNILYYRTGLTPLNIYQLALR